MSPPPLPVADAGAEALTAARLLRMPAAELDHHFGAAPAGPLPDGDGVGTAVVFPGTWLARAIAWFVRWFVWQGKACDRVAAELRNRVTPFSIRAIRARLRREASWVDGRDCVVIDYSRTSWLARSIRDEIRELAPGLYLGVAFFRRRRVLRFVLDTRPRPAAPALWPRRLLAGAAVLLLAGLVWAWARFGSDRPVTWQSAEDHFKYGSLGGERASGIPRAIWDVLPDLFGDLLPGPGLQSLGFLVEPGHDLPIGVSQRRVQGIDRVFVNCAVCHVGSVRDAPEATPRFIVGMPANTVDLQGFQRFLSACAVDEDFTAARIVDQIAARELDDGMNRLLLRLIAVDLMRQRLLTLRQRFSFMDLEPDYGPGRVDTFNPPKVLLNFRMDNLPDAERVGVCDFPSIWNQRQRRDMWLHWDGNNNSLQERNRSAAFGAGATPPTLDRAALERVEDFLLDARPPAFPYPIDRALADRGEPLYRQYCASCHGRSGTDFTGELVGQVTPIAAIGTDRWRLDSYSYELCVNQNHLYAGYPDERFRHFRKTDGYANQPLDGIWLRAPYLHNGSVPTLRDLLEPAALRPRLFFRGNDVYEPRRVGFVWDVPAYGDRRFFRFDTALPGNGNQGHEGPEYGTDLPAADKDAIVEYLKTF